VRRAFFSRLRKNICVEGFLLAAKNRMERLGKNEEGKCFVARMTGN